MKPPAKAPASMKTDAPRLERYLRKLYRNPSIAVVAHPKKADMAEVSIDGEFIATLYREEEDGEVSYQFQMAILDIDLDGV